MTPDELDSSLVAHVIRDEGFREKLYRDSLGHPTIGIGFALHALTIDELKSMRCLDAEGNLLATITLMGLNELKPITESQFDFIKPGLHCSREKADIILTNKLKSLREEVGNALIFYQNLDPAVKSAVLNVCYNIGVPRFLKFKKTIELLKAHSYMAAALELLDSDWTEQVKERALRIAREIYFAEANTFPVGKRTMSPNKELMGAYLKRVPDGARCWVA